jgi:predicted metal-dependent HD superfamily phosphohydrolase
VESDEAASARLATGLIEAAGLGPELSARVERLILATAHRAGAAANGADEAILVDADAPGGSTCWSSS